MRIALTITELHPGGAEQCFVNLALFLKEQGHEVAIWQLWPDPPPEKRQLVNRLDSADIPWRSGGAQSSLQFALSLRWLKRELRAFRPDVVQSFLFHANFATAVAAHRLAPIVGGVRVRQPEKWRWRLQRWASRRMDRLVCVSERVMSHCRDEEGIHADKLSVIPNGVDLAQLDGIRDEDWNRFGEFGIPSKAKVLLFVGRLHEQKGIVELVQRSDEWLGQLPQHHFVLVGEGPQRELVQNAIASSACQERIHLVGFQEDAHSWMKAAELLLLPAWYEGMPNVVLEAMACSKPVVTFDVDGIDELLGKTGTLRETQVARSGDYGAFSEKTIAIANQLEQQEFCGAQNRQRIEASFDLKKQLVKYHELYEKILQSKR